MNKCVFKGSIGELTDILRDFTRTEDYYKDCSIKAFIEANFKEKILYKPKCAHCGGVAWGKYFLGGKKTCATCYKKNAEEKKHYV